MSTGKSRVGRQSPYQDDRNDPPRPNTSDIGSSTVMPCSGGYTDVDETSRVVACEKCLQVRLRTTDGVDDQVGAEAAGQCTDCLDRILRARVDGVRRAEPFRPLELAFDHVNGDHHAGTGDGGARNRRIADTATSDDRNRVAGRDRTGADRCAVAGHHTAADERRGLAASGRINLHRLARVHETALRKCADAERRRQRRAVVEGHPLACVLAVEAVPGTSAQATPAGAAGRTPRDHHDVAGRNVGDAFADGLDDAGRLVAEQEGEVIADATLAVMQVGVADAAGLDPDERLVGTRVRNVNGHDFDWGTAFAGDNALNLVWNDSALVRGLDVDGHQLYEIDLAPDSPAPRRIALAD